MKFDYHRSITYENCTFLVCACGYLVDCVFHYRPHISWLGGDAETVLVTYRVQSGKEAEFQAVLFRAWQIYRKEHLVYTEPHIIVRDTEDGDKARFVEISTWVSHAALEHAPDTVKTIWKQEHSLCEARNGHSGIEGGACQITLPKARFAFP